MEGHLINIVHCTFFILLSLLMAPQKRCHDDLKILQWNCQGLYQSKLDELETHIKQHGEYDILALQETLWAENWEKKIGEYELLRIGERSGETEDMTLRGTCIGIHPKHQYVTVRKISNIFYDVLTIKIEREKNTPIYISNVYRKWAKKSHPAEKIGIDFIKVKGVNNI